MTSNLKTSNWVEGMNVWNWKARRCAWFTCAVISLLLGNMSGSTLAQEAKFADQAEAEILTHSSFRPADTSSPRTTLKSFINACNSLSRMIKSRGFFDQKDPEQRALAERILDCLDTSQLPAFAELEKSGEAATCLKEILDRVEIPAYEEIPGPEDINEQDGREKIVRWQLPGTRIVIGRVQEGPHIHEYLFTPDTVESSVEYYNTMKSLPYRTTGPEVTKGFYHWYANSPNRRSVAEFVLQLPDSYRKSILGLAKWKWIGMLIVIPVSIVIYLGIWRANYKFSKKYRYQNRFLYVLTLLFPVLAILFPQYFKYFIMEYISIRGVVLYFLSFTSDAFSILAGIFLAFALSNRIAEVLIGSPQIHPQGLDAQLIRIVCRLFSLLAAVIIFLAGGQHLGIPFSTLLASAGVGGLAVALSAQDMLKTLFGTIMLMADKPFRVGERIVFEKYDGVVEDIGLRSTRLRLLTGHQASIPNDELARSDIENIGRRPHIRRVAHLLIPIHTEREKVQKAVELIREILQDHEGMTPEYPPRVYFEDFDPEAYKIKILYWYSPADYWSYMAFSEKVNFQIFQKFEEHDIKFSLPTRVSYWGKDDEQKPLEVQQVEPPE